MRSSSCRCAFSAHRLGNAECALRHAVAHSQRTAWATLNALFVGTVPSLADGVIVTRVGGHSFRTADPIVNRIVTVEERHICMAIAQVLDTQKAVLEGAGALPVAAFLSGQLDDLKTKKVVVVLSGGNIDITVLGRVIERGLYYQHRMLRMTVLVSDKPGSLAAFLTLVAQCGCSVKDIMQARDFAQSGAAQVHVAIETRGPQYTQVLLDALAAAGYGYRLELDVMANDANQART